MICPVCKGAMMAVEYRNIELDYCHSCQGVWFDAGELELLLKLQGLEEPKGFLDGITLQEPPSPEKKRKCPICGRKMKKTAIGGQPEILVDVCHRQHGLWFDGGELTQVIRRLGGEHPSKRDSRGQVIGFLEEVFKAQSQTGVD